MAWYGLGWLLYGLDGLHGVVALGLIVPRGKTSIFLSFLFYFHVLALIFFIRRLSLPTFHAF